MGKGIEQELAGPVEGATKKSEGSIRSMFGRVGKLAVVAGTAIAGVFGASKVFGGGMARLMGIEEAQAKLRGLGNDTEAVEVIMANALASVKGTSFGMAEAATTAAGAVAAGIKPGADLERMLKTVSNSAAAAGTDMGEMGSIFNKVATTDMAQLDSLNQVADRGLPIFQALASNLGVTTEEVRKMASAGKISFADFEEAMISASGTVAEEMGGTLSGSIANFNASLGRIGANFLEGIFPKLAPAIQGLTGWLGGVEDAAKGAGEVLGNAWESAAGAISAFRDNLSGFAGAASAAFQDAGGGFAGFIAVIESWVTEAAAWLADGGVRQLVSGFLSGRGLMLDGAMQVFLAIAEALPVILPEVVGIITGTLIPGILGAMDALLPQLATLITTMLPALAEAFSGLVIGLGTALSYALPEIVSALAELLPMLLDTIVSMLPVLIGAFVGLILDIAEELAMTLPIIVQTVVELVPMIIDALVSALPALIEGAIALFMGLVDGLLIALPSIITAVVNAIPVIVTALTSALPMLIDGAIQLFLGLIDGLLGALPEILIAVVEAVPVIVEALVGALPLLVDGAIQLFLGLIEGLVKATPEIIVAVIALVPVIAESIIKNQQHVAKAGMEIIYALISGIGRIVPELISGIGRIAMDVVSKLGEPVGKIMARGREWIDTLGRGIRDAWQAVAGWFGRLGGVVSGLLGSAGNWLLDRGRQVIDGLKGGVERGWTSLAGWFNGLPSRIRSTISGVGSWLKSSGSSLISGFTSGIRSGFDKAMGAVRNGLTRIRNFFPFSPAKEGPFSGRGWVDRAGESLGSTFLDSAADAMSAGRRGLSRELADVAGLFDLSAGVSPLHGSLSTSLPGGRYGTTQHFTLNVPREAFRDVNSFLAFIGGLEVHAHTAGGG